jgi:proline dehydrogenase
MMQILLVWLQFPAPAGFFFGAPGLTRTADLLVRSQTLYPTELRAHDRQDSTTLAASERISQPETVGGQPRQRILEGVRDFLLFLSRQARLRGWMETSPLARRLAERFVAGETLAEALAVARRVNAEGISVTLDHLGENVTSIEEAAASRDEYIRALDEIQAAGLNANVSIKLSQFGIDLGEAICGDNAARLVEVAARQQNFVRVDMESSAYTDRTLRLVTDLHARFGATGAVIQAYLKRSEKDLEELNRRRIRVRLCKGAYLEPSSVAFEHKRDVDSNFVRLMKKLLESGTYPAIATHDEAIIAEAERFVGGRGIAHSAFEFQMLYGIRKDIQRRLVARGYRLRLYIPYGKAWYPYFMRRLAERPANVVFLLRNLLR